MCENNDHLYCWGIVGQNTAQKLYIRDKYKMPNVIQETKYFRNTVFKYNMQTIKYLFCILNTYFVF